MFDNRIISGQRSLVPALCIVVGAAFAIANAAAAEYPSRPIRIVVSGAPGGAADLIGRPVAAQIEKQTGWSLVVDNRAGANGIIATDIVAKAAPDGYTWLVNTVAVTINPSVYRKLPYDTERDILPVTNLALGSGYILIANAGVAANTVARTGRAGEEKRQPHRLRHAGLRQRPASGRRTFQFARRR